MYSKTVYIHTSTQLKFDNASITKKIQQCITIKPSETGKNSENLIVASLCPRPQGGKLTMLAQTLSPLKRG